ncbi:MAG: OmpA family protein [Verrucomicrobiales bacterium]|nr:OmpA family protein [Verrucomicrobiales bacterium]
MKALVIISVVVLLGGLLPEYVAAQINGESIATYISQDSGNPSENYLEYGYKLATTLKLLTPQQLARVFDGSTNVQLPRTVNELLEMDDINFEGGSAVLSQAATEELDKVVEYLAFSPKANIRIEGHAWYQNDRAQMLSDQRAIAAMNYLVGMGISVDRMEAEGFGGTRPLVEGKRSETTANRRIEIHVVEGE